MATALPALSGALRWLTTHAIAVPLPLLGETKIPLFPTLHGFVISWLYKSTQEPGIPFVQALLSYLFMLFAGNINIAILTGRPALFLSNIAMPVYALVFALFSLPSPLSPYSYIRPFRTPMVLLYSLIDGLGRSAGIHGTLHTLRHAPAMQQTLLRDHVFGLWVLGVIAASSGGLVDGLLGLRKKEWKFTVHPAFKDWSAGSYYRVVAFASAVYVGLTDVQVARLVSQALGQEDGAGKEGVADAKVEYAGLTSPETAQVIAGFILVAGHVLVLLVWPLLEKKRTISVAKGPKEKKG